MNKEFEHIVTLIQESRNKAYQAVNAELVNLYWQVGAYISERVTSADWGRGIVAELAKYIARTQISVRGFSDKNLWRMKQFYETYAGSQLLATAWRELGAESEVATVRREIPFEETCLAKLNWSQHRIIFGQCKTTEERFFYIKIAIQQNYSVRELERQITSSLFERVVLSKTLSSKGLRELPKDIYHGIKDHYVFEFLNLPDLHNESDLQKAILQNLKKFLLEFSRDFAFIGEEFPIQVGNKDFSLDLLFFNRALNCLVAIELKVTDFVPEHLGKINFYLEALDRDIKKPHENPSIGILLCKAKDDEVVEYAMSRQMNPAMVAEYQLHLPDKKLLQQKLNEFFEQNTEQNSEEEYKEHTRENN